MKTVVIESTAPLSWYFVADSSLVNAGKPFFIPDFADEFEAFLAPVVRINRIGKSIAGRFASRYYAEIAPGVHFRAAKLRRHLLEASLPPDPAQNFDRALTVGEFQDASIFLDGTPLIMTSAPENRCTVCETSGLAEAISSLLEAVSATNTMKMGDYLIPMLSSPLNIAIGDTLTVTLAEETLLTIQIK